MVRVFIIILISISILTISCNDCINCEPFTEEPFLKVMFLNNADSTNKTITIDSVNQLDAKLFRHFEDTTYEFKFPLDMHHDTSHFEIVYHKIDSPVIYMNNILTMAYDRRFIRRDDNYIVVECNITDFTTDFIGKSIKCNDSTNVECISNVSIAKVYN